MRGRALTSTTIRYLFATSWLPRDDSQDTVPVPGGFTTALDTAGNLLHNALWDLRRRGLIDFEQLRPVVRERVTVLGGKSFSRVVLLDAGTELPGLEGALLAAARRLGGSEHGTRRLVLALDLHPLHPWGSVCDHCFGEASAAGLVRVRGRLVQRVEIADETAVAALRDEHAELRALRAADMEREPDLHQAVIADCLHAVRWAFNRSD